MMLKLKITCLASLVVLLACTAGCNIYRSIEEPPDQAADSGAEDVSGDDATDTQTDDVATDASDEDTNDAQDGGDCLPVGDPDEASFYCDRANAECGDITVVDDCGTEHNVNCGSCGANASCSGGPTSFPRTCACDCEIGGDCYADGNVNPNNPCEVCDSANPSGWSDAPADTTCDDSDGLGCTGLCESGTCTSAVQSGSCAIDGACYADGDPNPSNPCEVCDPASSTDAWTPNDGATCDDSDGLSCTGVCNAGACESTPRDGSCAIDGTCYSDGEESSTNECQVCITAESQTAWSPSNAFSCGGSNSCQCNEQFECVKNNGTSCN